MPFYCDLCGKEMPQKPDGWESFLFGVICDNHNHEDIAKVVELTAEKVRENLIAELTSKFRNQIIDTLKKD